MKKGHKEPRPSLALFAVGLFFLVAGLGVSYALEQQTAPGGNMDHAHLAIAGGIVIAGVCWIAAWAKTQN